MNRSTLNTLIDVALGISFLIMTITGIIKLPFLVALMGRAYFVLPTFEISLVHDWSGIAFVIFSIVHIILHWYWWTALFKRIVQRFQK